MAGCIADAKNSASGATWMMTLPDSGFWGPCPAPPVTGEIVAKGDGKRGLPGSTAEVAGGGNQNGSQGDCWTGPGVGKTLPSEPDTPRFRVMSGSCSGNAEEKRKGGDESEECGEGKGLVSIYITQDVLSPSSHY